MMSQDKSKKSFICRYLERTPFGMSNQRKTFHPPCSTQNSRKIYANNVVLERPWFDYHITQAHSSKLAHQGTLTMSFLTLRPNDAATTCLVKMSMGGQNDWS